MYKTHLVKKENVADGTMKFSFEKPPGFSYKAGQSIDLAVPSMNREDKRGNMRPFTLSSAPCDEHLFITTRITESGFKNYLKDVADGADLEFDGPFGDLVLHENTKREAVFLAGGIGITPFYSIVRQAVHDTVPHKMFLFYSNRRPEDAPYIGELQDIEKKHGNFKCVATMTDMAKSKEKWRGETGYINEEMIRKYIAENFNPVFYVAGPAAMVKGMQALLHSMGISRDDIRTEEFTGY